MPPSSASSVTSSPLSTRRRARESAKCSSRSPPSSRSAAPLLAQRDAARAQREALAAQLEIARRAHRADATPVRSAGGDRAAARSGRTRRAGARGARSRRRIEQIKAQERQIAAQSEQIAARARSGRTTARRSPAPKPRSSRLGERIRKTEVTQSDRRHGADHLRASGRDRPAGTAALPRSPT